MAAGDVVIEDNGATVTGQRLKCETWDLWLDSPDRRLHSASGGVRRALVHDFNDKLTINYGADYPNGVQIQGNLEAAGNVAVKGALLEVDHTIRGGSLEVNGGGYVNGPITADGTIDGHDELHGRGTIILYSKQTVPFGQYDLQQLSQMMTKCGIDAQKIQQFIGMAAGAPSVVDPAITQAYLALTGEKLSAVSLNLAAVNPVAASGVTGVPVVDILPAGVVSSVDLLRFDAKASLVETPNLKVDGALKVGSEQMDLVSEIKAL